jgi:hypothetical protein
MRLRGPVDNGARSDARQFIAMDHDHFDPYELPRVFGRPGSALLELESSRSPRGSEVNSKSVSLAICLDDEGDRCSLYVTAEVRICDQRR